MIRTCRVGVYFLGTDDTSPHSLHTVLADIGLPLLRVEVEQRLHSRLMAFCRMSLLSLLSGLSMIEANAKDIIDFSTIGDGNEFIVKIDDEEHRFAFVYG